jgi:hypothetical protein
MHEISSSDTALMAPPPEELEPFLRKKLGLGLANLLFPMRILSDRKHIKITVL